MSMRMFSINLGAGNTAGSSLTGKSGIKTLSQGDQNTIQVNFSSSMGSTSYSVVCQVSNYTDTNPINIQILSVVKASASFTVNLSAPTDTANYIIEYVVVAHV